jgi:hypothetical protein
MMIQQPRVRTKTYSDKRFDKTASTFWNNLPSETQNEQSLENFKKNVIYTLPIHYKGGMININLEILEKHVKLSA